ncbi:MAG TPA: polysaccharide biosynthesis/export family protein [Blastocatellia bacterium]|nr:polysaccharide biosynthesis/export family protein [Blastocatellia bacterium]
MKKTVLIKITFATLMIVAVMASGVAAQQQPQQSGPPLGTATSKSGSGSAAPRNATNVLIAPDEDYRIGLGDVVEVKVENAPELSGAFRVTSSGAFQMYFVGHVMAKDKTTEEVSQFIADRLRGEYLRNPNVSVVVKEYNSRAFFIQGAVRGPGVFQIEGRPSLLKLITLAGGLAPEHGSKAFIIRQLKRPDADKAPAPAGDKAAEEEEYELLKVNINGLLRGDFDNNMYLEPGDIINIPLADVFFVAGEVNAPGEFPLKEGTTLRQAISMAQGMKFEAASSRGIIFRDDANGNREEMRVDIGSVMNGKKQDVAILPNDIIIVPNSQFKSVGGALLRAFGLTTVQRVPVR